MVCSSILGVGLKGCVECKVFKAVDIVVRTSVLHALRKMAKQVIESLADYKSIFTRLVTQECFIEGSSYVLRQSPMWHSMKDAA